MNTFVDAWSKYDRNATNWLPISRFVTMMQEAPWPFGLQQPDGSPMSKVSIVVRLRQLNVPVYNVPAWRLERDGNTARRAKEKVSKLLQSVMESPVSMTSVARG